MRDCEKKFLDIYKRQAENLSYTPYRVCPLGAHVDHQHGLVSGFAINKGIYFAYSPKRNGIIEVNSLQFSKRAQWTVDQVPAIKENDWADYLRGATIALKKRFHLSNGLCGVFEGELPIGGLSSSAAVILTFMKALCKLNNIMLSKDELIEIAKEAENVYVGVSCGTLDQSCEVLCKKDKLLFLDTKDGTYEIVEPGKNMKPFKFLVFFSGLERSLAASKFNMRTDECKAAAYALKDLAGLEYGKFGDTYLRDIEYIVFDKYKDELPLHWRKRATHFFLECERVKKGKDFWEAGDIEGFGKLVFESGESSISNYEVGSEELTTLFRAIQKQPGVYGARFSGAGFKGCCIAIANPEYISSIKENVEKEYLEAFPNLKGKYAFFECESADGIGR